MKKGKCREEGRRKGKGRQGENKGEKEVEGRERENKGRKRRKGEREASRETKRSHSFYSLSGPQNHKNYYEVVHSKVWGSLLSGRVAELRNELTGSLCS